MMKRRNRLIAMLLALVCIIPSAVMPTYAVLPETETEAVTDTARYRLLKALGIFDGTEDFSYVTAISRGQFISYVVRMYGRQTNLGAYENPFTDLRESNPYYADIISAYYLGIISGSGGEIRPDDDVTWAEAAKMLTGLLGYGAVCKANGGYPNGYVAQAGMLRLFPKKVTSEAYITPDELLDVLINTLETELCQVTATEVVGEEARYEFEILRNKTLLTEAHEVYEGIGIIDANRFTTLYGGSGCGQDKVRINNVIYQVGTTDASNLLGHKVDYFYKIIEDEPVLLFAEASKNDTALTIAADDISKAKTTERRLVYYDTETGKEEKADLAGTASLILNGVQQPWETENLCPADGLVTLVDSNADGEAEVVLVTSYRTIRVSSVSGYDYTITDLFGGEAITADPTDSSCEVVIEKDGAAALFGDIKKNDIISYAASSGGKVNRQYLVVSSQTVKGEVTESDDKSVVIEGKSYRVMSRLNPSDLMGKSGTFYLNCNGWIADFDRGQDAVYGYLNKVGYKDGAIAHTLQAQIYTENDRWVDADFANRVTVDGESMYSKDIVFPKDESGQLKRQLITYTVNSEGEINTLNFATVVKADEQWTDTEKEYMRNGVFRLSREYASKMYRNVNRSFDGYVSLAADAKIFCVPTDGSTDKDDFFMCSVSSLINDRTYNSLQFYDMNEGGICKVCVMDAAKVNASGSGGIKIVAGVGQTLTEDGERVPSLLIWMGDEKMSLPVENQSVLDKVGGVHAGDVVTYNMNTKECITSISKQFDSTEGYEQKFGPSSRYSSEVFAAGYVRYCEDNQLRFEAEEQILFTTSSLGTVYIYDVADKTVKQGTADDLREGSYGLVRLNYLKATDFIIFQ